MTSGPSRLRAFLMAMILSASAVPALAQVAPDSDESVLLLAVRFEGQHHQELFPGTMDFRESDGRVLAPLSQIAELLELDLDVDPDAGTASGGVLRRSRSLSLRVSDGRVRLGEETVAFDPSRVRVLPDDVYVDVELLSRWLPIDFEVNVRSLLLVVRPRVPLPMDERWLRNARGGPTHENHRVDGVRQETPYALLAFPSVDLSLRLSSAPDLDGGRRTDGAYAAVFAGDLAWLSAYVDVRGTTEEPVSGGYVRMGRVDPGGRLLGPLRARELAFGRIQTPGLDLVAHSRSGLGVRLGNFPLNLPDRFDTHSFLGPLLPDWEVELYRDDALVGYVSQPEDGTYAFPDVPLFFGLNAFRLVFYGPGGERREETREFYVGRSMVRPGSVHYRVGAQLDEDDRARGIVEVEASLAPRLSLGVALAGLESSEGEIDGYGQLRLEGSAGRWLGRVSLAGRADGGAVAEAGIDTRLGPIGISARHAILEGYESETFEPRHGPVASRTSLRLQGLVRLGDRTALPLMLEARRDGVGDGEQALSIHSRASLALSSLWITHELDWHTIPGRDRADASGRALVHRSFGRLRVRGELGYDISPEAQLTDVSATVDVPLPGRMSLSVGARRLLDADEYRFMVRLDKVVGAFGFGVTSERSSVTGTTASSTFDVGVARDPATGSWHTGARAASRSGSIAVRTFLDADRDGALDPGEEPVPGVALRIDGGSRGGTRTDRDGRLYVDDLSLHRPVVVSIEEGSLVDPLWVPGVPGIEIVPRAGRTLEVLLPVVVTGEVFGTVRIDRPDGPAVVEGVEVQLVDGAGEIVATTRTAYDGFFDLARVPPGEYALRVAPGELERLGLAGESRTVEIGAEGTILDGRDLELTEVGLEESE